MENGWKNVNSNPEKVHPAGAFSFQVQVSSQKMIY
jgi:hypothetical protein